MGRELTMVRSLQGKPGPDTAGLASPRQTSLRGMATKAKIDKTHRFENLWCGHDCLCRIAKASVIEEPGAGKLHAGIVWGRLG